MPPSLRESLQTAASRHKQDMERKPEDVCVWATIKEEQKGGCGKRVAVECSRLDSVAALVTLHTCMYQCKFRRLAEGHIDEQRW